MPSPDLPARRPAVFSIPPHVAFVDALAQGLLGRTGGDPLALARARVLLPNRRAVRALTDAFVRLSDGGLLLPRLTPIGDLDESGGLLDGLDSVAPPAFDACERRLRLARLVRHGSRARGDALTAVEALRLGDALAKALDTLTSEEIDAGALEALDLGNLAHHFAATLAQFTAVRDLWPAVLAATGTSDAQARANAVLGALAARWQAEPPAGMIVAAGTVGASPPLARLLGIVARLPNGLVVLPGVDTAMADDAWEAIRCGDGVCDDAHPQFALKQLLDRMSVARSEVRDWGVTTSADGPAERTPEVARAMSLAAFTGAWATPPGAPAFAGVTMIEAATAEEEAQAIALRLRGVLETPSLTAALVTPDRALARRVAAHCKRWGIDIDDSAGQPLALTPPGTLIVALAEAASQGFAPVPLLAVLKHPLVRFGDGRLAWLDEVRRLDLDLRGIRPAPGLAGVAARLAEVKYPKTRPEWWAEVAVSLAPLAEAFAAPALDLARLVVVLRDTAERHAGDELWRGPAGRALAQVVAMLTTHGHHLDGLDAGDAPALIAAFLRDAPVREAYGKHPRLAIYGTLEARLQRPGLVILGGLNDGVWPPRPAPDPWLAPAIRLALGLGGTQRAVGLAAHDFVEAMGAREVLLTRARRDDSAPTVASRFWLRLDALAGGAIVRDTDLLAQARALDRPARVVPATQPAPTPLLRPRRISVTSAERLKADPFSYYAKAILRLDTLSALDEDPSAGEKGIDLHAVLEHWTKGGGQPDDLQPIAATMLRSKWSGHPLMRALWQPRVMRALDWVLAESARWENEEGWQPWRAEAAGKLDLPSGIAVEGRVDRLDRNADGDLAIVDYKTGAVPSHAQVAGGFALQMGLLGLMAERGCFGDPAAIGALRYWKLGGGKDPGKATNPLKHRNDVIPPAEHIAATAARFDALAAAYLLGAEPFTAKLHPDYAARYSDYDHLARVAEWLARPSSRQAPRHPREGGDDDRASGSGLHEGAAP